MNTFPGQWPIEKSSFSQLDIVFNIVWKSVQWTLDVINKTGNNYLFPKPDELRQWIHSSKGETFDSNKLKEINPTVANVILNQQQKIENLLK